MDTQLGSELLGNSALFSSFPTFCGGGPLGCTVADGQTFMVSGVGGRIRARRGSAAPGLRAVLEPSGADLKLANHRREGRRKGVGRGKGGREGPAHTVAWGQGRLEQRVMGAACAVGNTF